MCFKLISFLAVGGYMGPPALRPNAFVRDLPAWMFPLFVIPFGFALVGLIFRVDILGEIWDFFERLIVGDSFSERKRYENLCVIYNVLNEKKEMLKAGRITKSAKVAEIAATAWAESAKTFSRAQRKKIKTCLGAVKGNKNLEKDFDQCIAWVNKKSKEAEKKIIQD